MERFWAMIAVMSLALAGCTLGGCASTTANGPQADDAQSGWNDSQTPVQVIVQINGGSELDPARVQRPDIDAPGELRLAEAGQVASPAAPVAPGAVTFSGQISVTVTNSSGAERAGGATQTAGDTTQTADNKPDIKPNIEIPIVPGADASWRQWPAFRLERVPQFRLS